MAIIKKVRDRNVDFWVVYDSNERILDKIPIKQSKLQTPNEVKNKFEQDNTLEPNKVKVRNRLFSKDEIDAVIPLNVAGTDAVQRTGTKIVVTKEPILKTFQVTCYCQVGNGREVKGYSTITNSIDKGKTESFKMVYAELIRLSIIGYDWSVLGFGTNEGMFVSPNGRNRISFTATYKIFNYVTKENGV
jgi:hypothetical protein